MMPTDARVGYDWLTPANDWTDGLQSFSLPLTCVRRPKRLHPMDGDMADSLSGSISMANCRIRERLRQELITLFPNEDKPALSPNAAPTSRP